MECYVFLSMGCELERALVIPLTRSSQSSSLSELFENVNVSECRCYLESDRQRMLAIVEAGYGDLPSFNDALCDLLLHRSKLMSLRGESGRDVTSSRAGAFANAFANAFSSARASAADAGEGTRRMLSRAMSGTSSRKSLAPSAPSSPRNSKKLLIPLGSRGGSAARGFAAVAVTTPPISPVSEVSIACSLMHQGSRDSGTCGSSSDNERVGAA